MNVDQYINGIVRKIQCGGKKKKEIKKQLMTDIKFRLEQGEPLPDVMSQMGSIKEIADGFNENLPETEKKKYARAKAIKITAIVAAVLAVVVISGLALVCFFAPKGTELAQSGTFDKAQVESAMKETVELLDDKDYAALRANATEEMIPYLTEDAMEEAKAQLSADWGERKSIGTIYATELTQGRQHYAVGEVTVTYENISVIYRLTYNEELQLTGLYIR